MKKILTFLIFLLCFHDKSSSQILTCGSQCPIPQANWETTQCEFYALLNIGDDLITQHWKKFPNVPNQNYYPISAKIKQSTIGPAIVYADFIYQSKPIDNYYELNLSNVDYRFTFEIFVFQGKKANIAIQSSNLSTIFYIEFDALGKANLLRPNGVSLGSFSYSQGKWISFNFFYRESGKMEIFQDNYKVANVDGIFVTTNTSFPSRMNFYAEDINNAFLLGGVCLVTRNTNQVFCLHDIDPVCLNGSNEEAGTNACNASSVGGYLSEEYHKCTDTHNPCDDCDECFNYYYDCVDPNILYLVGNYCDEPTPVFVNTKAENSKSITEYEWEFKNANNQVVLPQFLNGTNSTSFSPVCRLPLPGSYTVCFKVYKYQETGRYLAYICCYVVNIAIPCNSTPTLYITAGNPNSNNEVSFTTTTKDVDNFSWRVDDPLAYITNQSTSGSTFKCGIPAGRNCITVCLTVGNGCGMLSKCIKVCKTSANCGPKPPSHPPILYNVNQNGEVSFTNIPDMDNYEWSIPQGCTFTTGNANSKSPICKLPSTGCNFIFCVIMKLGPCYQICYCFTIINRPTGSPITFDPDDMSCVPTNSGFKVPVRVRSFKDVTSIEMKLSVNPSSNFVIKGAEPGPNIDPTVFLATVLNPGKVKIEWAGTSGSGSSLQDNDIFCYLLMESKAVSNAQATISIDADHDVNQNRIKVNPILFTGMVCTNSAFKICGKITREDDLPVKSVTVQLSGATTATTETDDKGNYCFNNVANGSYTIKPKKTIFAGNGISIKDFADIRGHVLGTFILPSPYKMIAADLDNNKTINSTDLSRLIPVNLNKNSNFAFVDSWRFVPKNYNFPNALNPFQSTFPEFLGVNVTKDITDADFYGIKMGDVNLDNDPQKLVKGNDNYNSERKLEGRTSATVDLVVGRSTVKPGQYIKVPISVRNFKKITSFGFSMNWQESKLKFSKVSDFNSKVQGLSTSIFNLQRRDSGNISLVWSLITDTTGVTLQDNEILFNLELSAIGSDMDSSVISITSRPTPISVADNNQSFDVKITNGSVRISSSPGTSVNDFSIKSKYLLWPNPVIDELTIESKEDQISPREVFLFDINGRVLPVTMKNIDAKVILNTTNLVPGTYSVKFKIKDKILLEKFVKM